MTVGLGTLGSIIPIAKFGGLLSVNHMSPLESAVMPMGTALSGSPWDGPKVVIVPDGVLLPIRPPWISVSQRLPSEPVAIW